VQVVRVRVWVVARVVRVMWVVVVRQKVKVVPSCSAKTPETTRDRSREASLSSQPPVEAGASRMEARRRERWEQEKKWLRWEREDGG
jgi:uncharacterized ion transporter superfamily protein YfcC